MARQPPLLKLHGLPDEIVLRILSCLEPGDFPSVQSTCRKLRKISLDNSHWRTRTFEDSPFLESLERTRQLARSIDDEFVDQRNLHGVSNATPTPRRDRHGGTSDASTQLLVGMRETRKKQHVKDIANWDPSFPEEPVLWYNEYVQRYAATKTNWLQQPRLRDGHIEDLLDVQGMALYTPPSDPETVLAVSPLDDGSICLWDVKGRQGSRKGAMVGKSQPGQLYIGGLGAVGRSRKIDAGVTECISVDSHSGKAFVAVQGHLMEVDLETLQVVSDQAFEWSIAALSGVTPGVPLTVGTSLGIHIYDYRARKNPSYHGVDQIFDSDPLPQYSPLSQPHPLSILHMPVAGDGSIISNDIYVAGRFSSILHYDRRKIGYSSPIVGTLHSGARLSSLTSLPYSFSPLDSEVRRKGELSLEQIRVSKAKEGRTLIAGGEYNSKGSLEMYAVSATNQRCGGRQHNSNFKNRYNAAESKILSVANQGTRIVVSDGSGYIKWFERDGFTEVRRHRIGHSEELNRPSLFSNMPGIDDLARKIVSTQSPYGPERLGDDEILFWTGDKLGLVTFGDNPEFQADDFEPLDPRTDDEERMEREEQEYQEHIRTALERQAADVRFVRDLGLGTV